MRIVKASKRLMGKIQGITLAPFCIVIREDKINDTEVISHEIVHWQQAKRLCYVGFYISYLWQWITKGYDKISFEIEYNKL